MVMTWGWWVYGIILPTVTHFFRNFKLYTRAMRCNHLSPIGDLDKKPALSSRRGIMRTLREGLRLGLNHLLRILEMHRSYINVYNT